MEDPLLRVRRLAASQSARQDQNKEALEEWKAKIPGFVKYLQEIVHPLRAEHGVMVGSMVSGIDIRFDIRFAGLSEDGRWQHENGARAVFVFGRDGMVHGLRSPAHIAGKQVLLTEFVCVGEPTRIENEKIGNAVADFLEWGAVGDGRSLFATPLRRAE